MLHAPLLLLLALSGTTSDAPPSVPLLELGTAKGVPGQTVRGSLPVGEESDGTAITLPIAIVTGRKPGPVVWVEAGAHGDEYGGPRALQEVVRSLDPDAMSGAVIAVMITNVSAFRGLQRVNPSLDDLQDFGDAFPGRERFATERLALAVSSHVKRLAHYFIDLHTGGDRFGQIPFVLYAITDGVPEGRYDDLARGFGVPILWRDTSRVFASDATTIFSAAGIPSFLLEVGGGQPLAPADINLQAQAVRSFLRKVAVLPGEPACLPEYTIVTGYWMKPFGMQNSLSAQALAESTSWSPSARLEMPQTCQIGSLRAIPRCHVVPASRCGSSAKSRSGLFTMADLKSGDLIEPGHDSNFGKRTKASYVYLTRTLDAATWGSELAAGAGLGRIYVVEPTGPIEDDPDLTNRKFRGNPRKSFRSREPLRVTGEITDWQGHSPDALKAMKDGIAQLERLGVDPIGD